MQSIKLRGMSSDFGALERIMLVLAVISSLGGLNGVNAQSSSTSVRQKSVVQQHLETLGNVVKLTDGKGQGSNEIMLRWTQSVGTQTQSQATVRQPLQVTRQVSRKDSVPKQRSAEIASGQLLVTVSDRQGVVRYTSVISDPRITIAEYADASGKLNRKPDIVNNDVQLEVSIPASIDVNEIRIYKASYSSDNKLSLTPLVSSVVSESVQ